VNITEECLMSEKSLLVSTLLKQSYFDTSVQQLALLLYEHSPLNLHDLIDLTKDSPALPKELLKNLKILINEHLVYATKEENEYFYHLDQKECLFQLYYPTFGNYTRKCLGDLSWEIISQFMLHKSLTLEKCKEVVKNNSVQMYNDEEIEEAFNRLFNSNYLQGVNVGFGEAEDNKVKVEKGFNKKSKKSKEKAERKIKEQIEKESVNDKASDKFLRLNYDKFIYQIKSLSYENLVHEKLGADAAVLLKIMLWKSNNLTSVYQNPLSTSLAFEQIYEFSKEPLGITKPTLQELLDNLAKDSFKCFFRTEGKAKYYVNLRVIHNELLNAYIEKLIQGKYGIDHARIYRILREKSQMEEKQMFENCLLPQTDIRTIIETLFKEGIVQQTELQTKSSGVIRLYSVKETETKDIFIRLTLKAIINIFLRIESEEKVEQKIDERMIKIKILKGCVAEVAEQLMILQEY